MKYLKTYENVNGTPKIEDYVICNVDNDTDNITAKFIKNNIGQIKKIYNPYKPIYKVKYNNIPNVSKYNFDADNLIGVQRHHIINYSENKEDMKILMKTKKYNI